MRVECNTTIEIQASVLSDPTITFTITLNNNQQNNTKKHNQQTKTSVVLFKLYIFNMNTDPKDRDCDCVLELMSVDGAFTCTIKKYSMIVQPYFYTPPFDAAGERWKLQCYPRGCGGENQGYCGWHVLSQSNTSCCFAYIFVLVCRYLYYLGAEDRLKVTYGVELRSGGTTIASKSEHAAVIFGWQISILYH